MKRTESGCVDCGLPCLGRSCPYYEVEVAYCDCCGDGADYSTNEDDYCENCLDEYLSSLFEDLSLSEKAEILSVDIEKI